MVGWRHLTPVCGKCAADRPAIVSVKDFAGLLDAPVHVTQAAAAAQEPPAADEPPIAVLSAEIALLHARLDEIQSRLDG